MSDPVLFFGLSLTVAAIIAVIMRKLGQSYIVALIIVGILINLLPQTHDIPGEALEAITETGIILLLFSAGMEVDINAFKKHSSSILVIGFGQVILVGIAGFLFSKFFFNGSLQQTIFFGVCIALSSTIVVIGYLRQKEELVTLHGQITLGLMVIQDLVAVIAIAALSGSATDIQGLAITVGKILLIFIIVYFVYKVIGIKAFNLIARSREIFFIGALGWVMGIAALAKLIGTSPEIGAFAAGLALSTLPYKLEIQSNIEPLKDFGIILFFIALGYRLNLTSISISDMLGAVILAFMVVLFTPFILVPLGSTVKLRTRSSFLIGSTVNQISEFSLVLATICLTAGIFSHQMFVILSIATVLAIVVSTALRNVLSKIYGSFSKLMRFIDTRFAPLPLGPEYLNELSGHIVILGFNEISEQILNYYSTNTKVILITIEPEHINSLKKFYPASKIIFADPTDPDIWEELHLDKANSIFSCFPEGINEDLEALNWLRNRNSKTHFIASTDGRLDALKLYDQGCTFVVQIEELAASKLGELLEDYGENISSLRSVGNHYYKYLKENPERTVLA